MAAKSDPQFFQRINSKESHYAWEQGKSGASTDDFTKPGYTKRSSGGGRYKSKISKK